LLTGGEAWNIAILSRKLRMANANCLSFGDDHSIEATRAKRGLIIPQTAHHR
jgi:hypothetical protein